MCLLASLLVAGSGCGDNCEQVCGFVTQRLEACRPASLRWEDLGAADADAFRRTCRATWSRERLELDASDLSVALDACGDVVREASSLTCEEIVALYAPNP